MSILKIQKLEKSHNRMGFFNFFRSIFVSFGPKTYKKSEKFKIVDDFRHFSPEICDFSSFWTIFYPPKFPRMIKKFQKIFKDSKYTLPQLPKNGSRFFPCVTKCCFLISSMRIHFKQTHCS